MNKQSVEFHFAFSLRMRAIKAKGQGRSGQSILDLDCPKGKNHNLNPQDPDRFRKNRKNKAVSSSVTNRVKSSNVVRKARIVARESPDPVAFFVTLMDPNAGRMALPI